MSNTDPPVATRGLVIEWPRIVLPIAMLALGVLVWDLVVRIKNIPPFILPGPGLVAATLLSDWALLWDSLLVTLATTFEGLALALAGGVGLAILFNQSRLIEHSLYPYAVILQVTPVVAVAPLLLIYLPQQAAVLACAWIAAFFPILANTTLGLNSVDRNLKDLFEIYGASRIKVLLRLELPSALPYMLGGSNRSEEHTSELQSHSDIVCRLLLEKKKHTIMSTTRARSFAAAPTAPSTTKTW